MQVQCIKPQSDALLWLKVIDIQYIQYLYIIIKP